jgi:hypothetical protein
MEEEIGAPESAEGGSGSQVVLPLEEFAEDLDLRLGRANGNIYHRRPGVEGVNDGQVMVRLKKKRFIVIDYSILPNEDDLQTAAMTAHISCPQGAGKQKCATPECPKVGVPVLLYDSDPNEPASLYLRSGLCFTCQRNLNEKRRTQRKRTSDVVGTSVLYAVGPGQKKFKMNGGIMELQSDAIILNGPPIDGAKSVRDGFGFHEIGVDLSACARRAAHDTDRLLNAVSSNTTTAPTTTTNNGTDSAADIAATAAAAAVAAGVGDGETELAMATDEATNAAVDAGSTTLLNGDHHHIVDPSSEDISALYDKAFLSLSKSIYLLSQWKQGWDAAIAAAVAQETVGDPSLADAVASAAAVVAAATDGQDSSTQNMVSLLLAADQRKEEGKPEGGDGEDVEAFEV